MVAMGATDARHGQLLMPPGLLLMPHGLLLMSYGLLLMSYGLPPMPHGLLPGPARHIMPLLPTRHTGLPSQGMDMPVRRHATMRLRPVSAVVTSLAMRTTARGRPFRCGASARSVRGNGSRQNG